MNRRLIREVWTLVVPVIIQGLVITVVFFTDRLLVGPYSDQALASMQISGPLLWSIFSVFGAFIAGTMAVIGRAVGANDVHRARAALSSVLVLAIGVGIVVAVVCLQLRPWFAEVLAGGANVAGAQSEAMAYMGVVFFAVPQNLILVTGVTALQADGDTRSPMWFSLIQGVVNLGLSWILLWGIGPFPELGIVGAGIGTLASFTLGALLVLGTLRLRGGTVSLRTMQAPSMDAIRPILRLSGPAFGEKIVFHTAFVIFAAYVGHLGTKAMTANQALIAIESLGFIVAHGFSVAASSLVAQKMGANRLEEASQVGWISAGLGTLVLGSVGVLFWFFPGELIGLFTQDPATIEMGIPCLRIAALVQPLMAICEAMAGGLRGAGDTRTPMVAALVGPGLVRLGMCWFLAFHMNLGLLGIWYGTSLDWVVRAAVLVWVYKRGAWKRIEV
ncbi:MAG: MATE family efflux transporter [Myxococcota bacterium]|nr:MATE family efflux transporter [Myxococcota bacterium]